MIKCWCDGSCKPTNPGPAGVGFVIVLENGQEITGSYYLGEATNNIAELTAVAKVLDYLKEHNLDQEEIEITTDSQYTIGMFSKNWKAKLNTELVATIRKQLEGFPKVRFSWVRGHIGNHYNEMVDKLAKFSVDSHQDFKV